MIGVHGGLAGLRGSFPYVQNVAKPPHIIFESHSTMPATTTKSLLGPTTGQLTLEIDRGEGALQTVHMRNAKCSIGSDPRCEIRIRGEGIRPVHCVILRSHDRTIVRRWAGNTWLNGRPFDDTTLRRGDELRLANVRIHVVEDERSPMTRSPMTVVETRPGRTRLRRALQSQSSWGHEQPPRGRHDSTSRTALSDLSVAQLLQRVETAESRVEELQRQNDSIQEDSDQNDSQLASRIASLEAALTNAIQGPVSQDQPSALLAQYSQEADEQREAWQQEISDLKQALLDANRRIEELESEGREQEQALESLAAQAQAAMLDRESAERERDKALSQLESQQNSASPPQDVDEREAIWQAKFDELEAEREAEEAVNRQYQDDLQERVKDLTVSLSEYEQEVRDLRSQITGQQCDVEEKDRQLEQKEAELATLRATVEANDSEQIVEFQQRFDAESKAWEEKNVQLAEQIAAFERQASETAANEALLIEQRDKQTASIDLLTKERDDAVAARDQAEAARDATVAELDKVKADQETVVAGRDELSAEFDAAIKERDELVAERDQWHKQRDTMATQQDALVAERDDAVQKYEAIETAQATLIQERDDAITQRDEAIKERDELAAEVDKLVADRDQASQKHEQALVAERDEAAKQRDDLIAERDKLIAERDAVATERDEAAKQRDDLIAERDQLSAGRDTVATERDKLVSERDDAVNERDKLISERDDAVNERDELAAERDKVVANRDELVAARDELASQIAELQTHAAAASASNVEVEKLQRDLAQEREAMEQLKEQLAQAQAEVEAYREKSIADHGDGPTEVSRGEGYVDVALDYTAQFDDEEQLAEIAPGLAQSPSDELLADDVGSVAAQFLQDVESADAGDSPVSDVSEQADDEGLAETIGDAIASNRLVEEVEAADWATAEEQPAPVSHEQDDEEPRQTWSLAEDEPRETNHGQDDEVEMQGEIVNNDGQSPAEDFLKRLDETSGRDADSEFAGDDFASAQSVPVFQDEYDGDEVADTGGDNSFTNDDAVEVQNNTHDYLGRLGEKPDFGLALDEPDTAPDNSLEPGLFDDDTGTAEKQDTHDFLGKLGDKPDFGLALDEVDPATPDNSLEPGLFDDDTGTAEKQDTHDFLGKLGDKPDFGLALDEVDPATPDHSVEPGLFDDDTGTAEKHNTHDFLGKLGEKPDFGLSTNQPDGETTNEDAASFVDEESSPDASESNTLDFLEKLGQKPDFGLSAADASEDPNPWEESSLLDDDGSETGAPANQHNTHDFLSKLGEKPDFGLSTDDVSEASTVEPPAKSSLFADENDVPATVSENTHDFLGKIGEKPDFGLADADETPEQGLTLGEAGLFDDDDEPNRVGENPDSGVADNIEDDPWDDVGSNTDDDKPAGITSVEAQGEIDDWGLPVDDPCGQAEASAASDDLVATPEQEVTSTDLASDDDVSIEDYMNNLLARVGGAGVDSTVGASQTPATPAKANPPAPDAKIVPTPRLMEAAQSMVPSEFVPRSKAPEANLDAMREVANATARSAIDRAQKTRTSMELVTSVGVSLIPVFTGLILMVFGIKGYYVLLVFGMIAFLVGVFLFYRSLAALNAGRDAPPRAAKSTPA